MPENVVSTLAGELTPATRRAVQAIKRSVLDAARQFGAVREKLSDLAPKVVKLYQTIQSERANTTFVDFVRMIDPTVPTHARPRDNELGYQAHRTYYTIRYMQRLVQTAGRAGRPAAGQGGGVRDTATDALARTLATIFQVVKPADIPIVFNAIQSEYGFSERLMTRLKTRVENTEPLITIKITRPANVGDVIHMERPAPATDTEQAMTGRGNRVALPATAATPARKRGRAHAA